MASYIEQIKVGSNESWIIRDAETAARVDTLSNTVGEQGQNISELSEQMSTMNSTVDDLSEEIQNDMKDHYLSLKGGTLTGDLCLTQDVHYGTELPAAGKAGRIFFKIVETASDTSDEEVTS